VSAAEKDDLLTRRGIARAAIKKIWEWQDAGLPLMSQEELADEVGVVSGATVGNALTAYGDEECQKLHPGMAPIFTSAEGYQITERLTTAQLAVTVGQIKCAITKDRRAISRLGVRRNPPVLKDAAKDLQRAQDMVHKPALADAEKALKAEREREKRRKAAVKAGRRKV
jgi:hypothetical protein